MGVGEPDAQNVACQLQDVPSSCTSESEIQVKKSNIRICIDFAKKYFMEGQNLNDGTTQLITEKHNAINRRSDFSSESSFDDKIFIIDNTRKLDASSTSTSSNESINNPGKISTVATVSKSKTDPTEAPTSAPNCLRRLLSNRRLVGILLPLVFFHVCWWCLAVKHNFFQYFKEKYVMTLTMVGGAMIAGMTSEGGGSVAFPVMTLALKVNPIVARDFSLMIQSCGMSAAAFTIWWMGVRLEVSSLIFCSFGAVFGMVFGLEVLDSILHPAIKKLGFVSIWFSFAFALFLLNRKRDRPTFDAIRNFGIRQAAVLILTGFAGGTFSALSGSGVDICSFSVLCLLFRVSEKVATPTSVILMAINTCVGFFWRELMTSSGADKEAWEYMAVCVPVVVICAPLGSMIASHFHRLVLAAFVYITDTVALVSALCLIPMFPNQDPTRIIVVVGLILGGFSFFGLLSWLGGKYCEDKGVTSIQVVSADDLESNINGNVVSIDGNENESNSEVVSIDGVATKEVHFVKVIKEFDSKQESNENFGESSSSDSGMGSDSPANRTRRISHHYS